MARILLLLLLLVTFVSIPVALFFALRWVALRWLRNRPHDPLLAKVTLSGLSGSRPVPPSRVLPPETSLLSLVSFVPPGFKCGVEVLNDNTTPMEFVVSMLATNLGLSHTEAIRAMLTIHEKGGALLPTATRAAADVAAHAISSAAASQKYPLVCRAVCVE